MAVKARDEAAPQNHPYLDSFPKPAAQELRCGFSGKDSSAQAVSNSTDRSRIGEFSARRTQQCRRLNGELIEMIAKAVDARGEKRRKQNGISLKEIKPNSPQRIRQ